MRNYRVQFVNLETGYTTIQIYPTIEEATDVVNKLMIMCQGVFRITITTKNNNQ